MFYDSMTLFLVKNKSSKLQLLYLFISVIKDNGI